jgi:hypothetical protein
MSTVTWTSEKQAAAARHSLLRRLAYGPVLILALGLGASGVLVGGLLLSPIFGF